MLRAAPCMCPCLLLFLVHNFLDFTFSRISQYPGFHFFLALLGMLRAAPCLPVPLPTSLSLFKIAWISLFPGVHHFLDFTFS